MKLFATLLLAAGALASCHERTPAPNEDAAALHSRFHGKYQLLSAVADVPVDLDRDGRASTNLVEELPDVKSSDVILLIKEDNSFKLFEQLWPQPYVGRDWNSSSPDSLIVQAYDIQLSPRYFTFDKSVANLLIEPGPVPTTGVDRFPTPEVAAIEPGDQLRIVVKRALFTRKGWKLVRITTLYKRYTMVT